MSDFTATRAHVYTTGAVIYAAYHNSNENEIYNKHNAAVHATTGHTHTGGTGDGPKLTSTGLDLTASYAWTGTHTWTQNMALNGGSAEAKFTITSGTTTGSSRYFYKNSNDTFGFETDGVYTAGDVSWLLQSKTITAFAFSHTNSYNKSFLDFAISNTKKLYWDETTSTTAALSGDTWTSETAANFLTNTVGGVIALQFDNATAGETHWRSFTSNTTGEFRHFVLNSNSSVYFEQDYSFASGDVYWALQSNTKTPLVFSDTNNFVKVQSSDFAVIATCKIRLDAPSGTAALSGDTWIVESSANVVDHAVGGTTAFQLTTTRANFFGTTYYVASTGDANLRDVNVRAITSGQGLFSTTTSSGSNLYAIEASGVNAGAGAAYGMAFTTASGTLDEPLYFATSYYENVAVGAFYRRLFVSMNGTRKYIAVYDA